MSSLTRRLRQQKKSAFRQVTVEGRGYDLSTVKLTDIERIELEVDEEELTVNVLVPIGNNDAYADYEEVFDLGEDESPAYVKRAARDLVAAAARAVQERELVKGEPMCTTCTGACCRNSTIQLTQEDVDKMRTDGVMEGVIMLESPTVAGHVAQFAEVEAFDGHGTSCPNLKADGCSIYEHRPSICREYSPWVCSAYEEDPQKVDGKVRLRVVPPAAAAE